MENLITIQCTNPGLWENHLTSGKTYTAQLDEDDTYKVIDDSGEANYYFRYRFEVVTINIDQYAREMVIAELESIANEAKPLRYSDKHDVLLARIDQLKEKGQ